MTGTTPPHPLQLDCPYVSQILARIGEKWSMLVVMLLRAGPRRFNDIKRNTGGISQQMLTRTLRCLERDGIVTRTIFPTSPPQVEYRLTELGYSLSEPVLAFGQWVREHLGEFDAARHRFDQRDAGDRPAGPRPILPDALPVIKETPDGD
jgi:DNA-binding HxlR family transcriptional regulator